MNIIEAVQSGKKFRRLCWDNLYCDPGLKLYQLSEEDLLATDYELYEEGIRPKEDLEIWAIKGESFVTFQGPKVLQMRGVYTGIEYEITENIIHGQNSWQRIHPPVEDERVEKLTIEAMWPTFLEWIAEYTGDAKMAENTAYSREDMRYAFQAGYEHKNC